MLRAKLAGTGSHFSRGQKKGWVNMRQPTGGSVRGSSNASSRLYRAIRRRISASEVTPFLMPNASQASDNGTFDAWLKTPPPTIKSSGAWSLNRNSSPTETAPNLRLPLGCQKLTSSGRSWLSSSNQLRSVTATNRLTTNGRSEERRVGKEG